MPNRKRNRKELAKILDDGEPEKPGKPESEDFFEFLKTEDPELLQFAEQDLELSDDENSDDENVESSENAKTEKMSDSSDEAGSDMEFCENLESASDSENEENEEMETEPENRKIVTKSKIEKWIKQLETGNYRAVLPVSQSLYASIIALDTNKEKTKEDQKMANNMITTVNLFTDICKVALTQLPIFLIQKFEIERDSKAGSIVQHPMWKKCRQGIKILLKGYLLLMDRLIESSARSKLLTAIRLVTIFYPAAAQHKNVIKLATRVWSSSEEETHRVQAFLIIHKLVRLRPDILDSTLRQMYMAYVSNTKFVNPSTLPNIYFMQKCLLELYKQDTNVSYQHGFLYIRQLAIHLRKGLMNVSKETLRSVANWQFVFALKIWCKIVTQLENMDDLVLPLLQIIFGVFDLISASPRLMPLTFHMLRCALMLCGPEQKYVPLWAPMLEILHFLPTGKKVPRTEVLLESDLKKSGALPDFQMALKLSGAQIKNKRLADTVLDEFYEVCLTYGAALSHRVDFPELTRIFNKRLREFTKNTKNANHRNCIKKLLTFLGDNCNYISAERAKARFTPKDKDKISKWQQEIFDAGTPLLAEIENYKKLRERERRQKLNSNLSGPVDDAIPNFKTFLESEEGQKSREADREEFKTLFDRESGDEKSDEELDEENLEESQMEEEELDVQTKVSKKERKALKKGAKDKVEEFSMNAF